ncbi:MULTISPECIES: DsbA family protein [Actinomyces]|uniref:Thioredoxin domain-containing protein n=1 Tax=Actinomyces respiraculi TaxID=2744574 RepID=A0A7T0PVN1_9ACTO|nr:MULTISPECIES: thioredoxin domain-containing protein [Actinomyces]QPL05466.1 thioredoxin domain-containing protein [Actinomyces respiraculi]
MTTVPTPTPESTSPASNKPGPHPAVLTVLIIIAVLLALIAAMLVVRDTDGPAASTTLPVVAGSPTQESQQTPAPAQPTAQPTSAASVTDEQVLELMHAEVHRDPEDGRARGALDAPVVLVLYSDFSCPYCTLFAQNVEPGLADLVKDGTLRIEWRDLAQISASSPLAAQAGIAAANQGRFWEFHDAVYAAADPQGHPEYTEESLVAFAEQAGVADLERFRTDMTAQETVDRVSEATAHAHQLGIKGTPFLIVNDAVIGGYTPVEFVRQTVLEQAELVG